MTTTPDGHAPALAAPQSHVGKTSSFMIPPILSTFDRVVVTTTKPDMVGATTLARGAGDKGGSTWFSRRLPISRSRT